MIGITGVTGRVGARLAAGCAARGLAAVGLARRPEAVRAVAARRFAFEDRASWGAALAGVKRLFLVAPPGDPENVASEVVALLTRARDLGVEHVTFCSARAMVFIDRPVSFHRIEAWLSQGWELSQAVLRPSWYMQNFSGPWLPELRAGLLSLPAGEGVSTWVDCEDVAAAALETVSDPARWSGKTLTLCGPEALGMAEAVQRISQLTGLACRYQPAAPGEWVKAQVEKGVPPGQARFLAYLMQLLAGGSERGPFDDLPRVIGRPGGSFEDFVRREFARAWPPSPMG